MNSVHVLGWTMTTMLAYRALSFVHIVPNKYWNRTSGLLGNFNGDMTDDLTTPSGEVIPITSTTQDIHYQFGLTCMSLMEMNMHLILFIQISAINWTA